MTVTIIGIDCAVDERNVGIAIGNYSNGICNLLALPSRTQNRPVTEIICEWINQSTQTLLALDAPLGWPVELGNALSNHMAGERIDVSPNHLFRRATDRFVKAQFRKQSLDVGADRIARTAKAALDLLDRLRAYTAFPIPLVWKPSFTEKVAAIEVYPAGTLISYGLPSSGYKKVGKNDLRMEILNGLKRHMNLLDDLESAKTNSDVLDAIVCVLSGAAFLRDQTYPPNDFSEATKEGWIWIKRNE